MMSYFTMNQIWRGNWHAIYWHRVQQHNETHFVFSFYVSLPVTGLRLPSHSQLPRTASGMGRMWCKQPAVAVWYELLSSYFYFPYILWNNSFKKIKGMFFEMALFIYVTRCKSRAWPPHVADGLECKFSFQHLKLGRGDLLFSLLPPLPTLLKHCTEFPQSKGKQKPFISPCIFKPMAPLA